MAPIKYNEEFVRNYLNDLDMELLSEYKNVKTKFTYKCSCGTINESAFDAFINAGKKSCKKCVGEKSIKPNKLTYEYVKKRFDEEKCVLLESEYIDSKTKMKYICACGEKEEKSWNHFNISSKCEKCVRTLISKKQRTPTQEVKNFLQQNGFELLQDEFVSYKESIKVKCICGEIVTKTYSAFKSSPKCNCHLPTARKSNYTKEQLVEIFWNYFYENKKFLIKNDLKLNKNLPPIEAFNKHWGNWDNFILEQGIMGTNGWYKHDEDVVKEFYLTNKDGLKNKLIVNHSLKSIKNKAIELNILKVELPMTNEELLNDIVEFHKKYNRNPKISDFENYTIYRTRFGKWSNALKQAGLYVKEDVKFSDEQVNQIIRMYNDGLEIKIIGESFNVSTDRIMFILRKYKVTMRNKRWSKEQINILKKLYPYEDWDIVLNSLKPFTKSEIHQKASKLEIKRENYSWTEDEINWLIENYTLVSTEDLINRFPQRTETAIRCKANKLQLKTREFWSDEEIKLLKEVYPFMTNVELLDYFPNRSDSSISSMGNMILGLKKDDSLKDRVKSETKVYLLEQLKLLANKLGRTPYTYELCSENSVPAAISYHRIFGNYTNACIEAGLDVNAKLFGLSVHAVSDNGDICLSKKELDITNLFIKNKITYVKEALYKDIIKIYKDKNIRCDWYINGIIVEYFGMPEKEDYYERMQEKIDLCKSFNQPFIDLYEEDTRNNFEGLIEKFNQKGIIVSV